MLKRFLCFGILFLIGLNLSAQDEVLKFTLSKNLGEQKTVYFHIKGIEDDEQSDKLLERLLSDPLIYDGRIYETPTNNDRCQLYMDHEIDAAYVKSILQEFNLDYEYTTVSRNGHLEAQQAEKLPSHETPKTPVVMEGFPEYVDTGNPEADKADYARRKKEWVEQNPEKYEEYLEQLK